MSVKINVKKELGIKKLIEVKESNRNLRALYKLQLEFAKMEKIDENEQTEIIEKSIQLIDDAEEFVTNILKLSDDDADKLAELSMNELTDLITKITSALTGTEMEKVDDGETNPKSE